MRLVGLIVVACLLGCAKNKAEKPPAPSPEAPTPSTEATDTEPIAAEEPPSPEVPEPDAAPTAEPLLPNLEQGGILVVAEAPPVAGPLSILGDVAVLSLTSDGYVVRGSEELAASEGPKGCDSQVCWEEAGKAVGTAYVLVVRAEPEIVSGSLYGVGGIEVGGSAPYGPEIGVDAWEALRTVISGLVGMNLLRKRGTLTPEALREVEESIKGRMRGCYHDVLEGAPKGVQLAITFVVSPEGRVGRVVMHRSSHPVPNAEQCLRRVLQNEAFPKPEGGDEIIHWGLTFPPP